MPYSTSTRQWGNSAAMVDWLIANGIPIPDNSTAYLRSCEVTQSYDSLPEVTLTLLLSPSSGKSREKPPKPSLWINTSSQRPDNDLPVLARHDDYVRLAVCSGSGRWTLDDYVTPLKPKPTHWMPIPEAQEKT